MSDMEITLTGTERPDGSHYLTSKDLPGFHFILGPDEDPREALLPAVLLFMPIYYSAKIHNAKATLKTSHPSIKRRKNNDIGIELSFA